MLKFNIKEHNIEELKQFGFHKRVSTLRQLGYETGITTITYVNWYMEISGTDYGILIYKTRDMGKGLCKLYDLIKAGLIIKE